MERALIVYTTFPDEETGLFVGEALVREGLAACVNLIPGMRSVYAWKGAIERGHEVVGIVKSREGRAGALKEALVRLHPYETPIVLMWPVPDGHPATLDWLLAETGGGLSPRPQVP
jgi:periplasmic divalent cation tolerance protein